MSDRDGGQTSRSAFDEKKDGGAKTTTRGAATRNKFLQPLVFCGDAR